MTPANDEPLFTKSLDDILPPDRPRPAAPVSPDPAPVAPPQSARPVSAGRILVGMGIGLPVGGATRVATGWFSGAVLMLLIRLVMRYGKGAEYHGDFQGDLFWVAQRGTILLGALGLLAGLVVGGRVGRRGEPLLAGTVRGSWNAFGVIATGVGAVLAPLAAGSVAAGHSSSGGRNAQ